MLHPARVLPVVALAILACLPDRVRGQETRPVQRVACGDYEAVPSGFRAGREPTRLSIQKKGRLLVSITDWRVKSAECDDVTADGVPELVVRTFSGGAHCCETLRVYALGDVPRQLLLFESNHATGVEVRDIDGDGRRELILGDDTFAYFDDLCSDCSPAHLPLVACHTDARFEDCTRRFPELLRARRADYLARVGPSADSTALGHVKGAALGVLATSVLLGEEEQAMSAIRQAGPAETVIGWLSKILPRVREWAATRGTKLKDGKGAR
jgi:hypothetical protein